MQQILTPEAPQLEPSIAGVPMLRSLLAPALLTVAIASLGISAAGARDAAAPSFELSDSDGGSVTLDQYRGKPLVLNFWATWCPPCQVELPALSAYAKANPDVAVVGVAVDSGASDHMPRLRTELGIEYEVYAANGSILRDYGVRGLPTTVVVGSDGNVAGTWTGAITEEHLAELVSAAR